MLTLAEQHELNALKREVSLLRKYKNMYKQLQTENKTLKRRVRIEIQQKSKYKRKWIKVANITPIEDVKRNQAIELLVYIAKGFAMTLKDVSRITGIKYSTIKSINKGLQS